MADLAGDAHHAFAAQGRGRLDKRGVGLAGVEHGLRAPFAVAHVQEDDPAQIAAGVDPAVEGDRLPDVGGTEFVAMVRASHEIAGFSAVDRRPKRRRMLAGAGREFKTKRGGGGREEGRVGVMEYWVEPDRFLPHV